MCRHGPKPLLQLAYGAADQDNYNPLPTAGWYFALWTFSFLYSASKYTREYIGRSLHRDGQTVEFYRFLCTFFCQYNDFGSGTTAIDWRQ